MSQDEKNIELERDLASIRAYKTSRELRDLTGFFQKYMGLMYGVCLKYLKEEERAKDAVMEIYEKLAKKLLKHEVSNPKSWLFTLVKNHCFEILRSKKRSLEKESQASFMYSEQVYHLSNVDEKESELGMLEHCISELEIMQQKTIKLFYIEKKTYKEVCEILTIKWAQARSLIQNGRRNLKICMEKKYESIREK